jgi:hypothetical protein
LLSAGPRPSVNSEVFFGPDIGTDADGALETRCSKLSSVDANPSHHVQPRKPRAKLRDIAFIRPSVRECARRQAPPRRPLAGHSSAVRAFNIELPPEQGDRQHQRRQVRNQRECNSGQSFLYRWKRAASASPSRGARGRGPTRCAPQRGLPVRRSSAYPSRI